MVDNYQLLANAIVKQAARDYERALVMDHINSTNETRGAIKELERYFTGNLIKLHTKLDGKLIMDMVKADVKEYNYDLVALRRAHSLIGGEGDYL